MLSLIAGTRTVGEDDLLARPAQLLSLQCQRGSAASAGVELCDCSLVCARARRLSACPRPRLQVQLSAHSILRVPHVGVQQVGVQRLGSRRGGVSVSRLGGETGGATGTRARGTASPQPGGRRHTARRCTMQAVQHKAPTLPSLCPTNVSCAWARPACALQTGRHTGACGSGKPRERAYQGGQDTGHAPGATRQGGAAAACAAEHGFRGCSD